MIRGGKSRKQSEKKIKKLSGKNRKKRSEDKGKCGVLVLGFDFFIC